MTIRHDDQLKHELIITRRLFRQILAKQVLEMKLTTKRAAAICCCCTRTMRRAVAVERKLLITEAVSEATVSAVPATSPRPSNPP